MNPTDPAGIPEVLKMFGGASATAILGVVVFYLVRFTIPDLQKTFRESITLIQTTFEAAIAKRDARDEKQREQHDLLHAKLMDALLKRDDDGK